MIVRDLIDATARLVSFDTVSSKSSTVPIADFISEFLEDSGFRVSHTEFGNPIKRNVIAVKGDISESPCFALSGHMDTVSYDLREWRSNPFKLTEGKAQGEPVYYGLGVTDMKLFLAISLMVAKELKTEQLRNPFALYFTSDEEIGCIGAKRLVSEPSIKLAKSIVIGEPTELLPCNRHKGYLYFRADLEIVRGSGGGARRRESCHSSDDRWATNILTTVLPIALRRIEQFTIKLRGIQSGEFEPPYPTVNVGRVIMPSNASKNIIPSQFSLEGDIRFLPNQDPEMLLEVLRRYLADAVNEVKLKSREESVNVKVSPVRRFTNALFTPASSKIAFETNALSKSGLGSISFNTEGGTFNTCGADTIIYGPGSIKQAHKPDEYVLASYFDQSVIDKYIWLTRKMCE